MSQSIVVETAEAICSALHKNDFEFIGEPAGPRLHTWWRRGEYPEDVRVVVHREYEDDQVRVSIEWHNASMPPTIRKGSMEVRISCNATMLRAHRENAVEACLLRILSIYRDVLDHKGIGGPVVIRNTRKNPGRT